MLQNQSSHRYEKGYVDNRYAGRDLQKMLIHPQGAAMSNPAEIMLVLAVVVGAFFLIAGLTDSDDDGGNDTFPE